MKNQQQQQRLDQKCGEATLIKRILERGEAEIARNATAPASQPGQARQQFRDWARHWARFANVDRITRNQGEHIVLGSSGTIPFWALIYCARLVCVCVCPIALVPLWEDNKECANQMLKWFVHTSYTHTHTHSPQTLAIAVAFSLRTSTTTRRRRRRKKTRSNRIRNCTNIT